MRFQSLFFALLLAGCSASNAPSQAPEPDASAVIAEIDGRRITLQEVDEEIDRLPEALRREDEEALRRRIVAQLLQRKALAAAAERAGLHRRPEVHRAIERARDRILAETLLQELQRKLPAPSEEELRRWYRKHRTSFHRPEQAHGRWIVVRTREEAMRLWRILRRHPKRFAELAATYSIDDATKSIGGDLNWVVRGVLPKAAEQLLFRLEPGAIAKPVQTPKGWAIVQLLDRRPAHTLSFEEARDLVLAGWRKDQLRKRIEDLIRKAPVRWRIEEYRPSP